MDSIVSVTNLTRQYQDITAVDDISFDVKKGEMVAFLGPNGAGKTTTIKMLTTLLVPTKGTVLLDGHDVVKDQEAARRAFGIVFQDPSLDDELTAWENMEFHGVIYGMEQDTRRKRTEELMKFVELWDRKNALVKTFSGGMKRRLEIARGLLHKPKIFFLDEPTQGLDPQTRNHMWEYMVDLNKQDQITVFFTTHYIEEAERFAQRIIVIDHGKLITSGTPADLMKLTKTTRLEEAFLQLTGHGIRDEEASSMDRLRQRRQMWKR